MVNKINFESKWNQLARIVFLLKSVPDVIMMERLDFSPSSWKVWKSKLIEKAMYHTADVFSNEENREIQIKIKYIKKDKKWEWEDCAHIENNSPFEKRERE